MSAAPRVAPLHGLIAIGCLGLAAVHAGLAVYLVVAPFSFSFAALRLVALGGCISGGAMFVGWARTVSAQQRFDLATLSAAGLLIGVGDVVCWAVSVASPSMLADTLPSFVEIAATACALCGAALSRRAVGAPRSRVVVLTGIVLLAQAFVVATHPLADTRNGVIFLYTVPPMLSWLGAGIALLAGARRPEPIRAATVIRT